MAKRPRNRKATQQEGHVTGAGVVTAVHYGLQKFSHDDCRGVKASGYRNHKSQRSALNQS